MSTENSHPLVKFLAGHIVNENQELADAVTSLQQAFNNVGLDHISHIDLSNISHLADLPNLAQDNDQLSSNQTASDLAVDQFHVFARTAVVKSSQIAGGSNPFLGGTLSDTFGPFVINQQPPFFIDFIRLQRSIALFIQGNPLPVLYFKITINIFPGQPPFVPRLNMYNIVPTSVWVQANILHAFAPPYLYAGLKISSGTLQITGNFTTNQSGIILDAASKFVCQLQLVQKANPVDIPEGQYGQDARDSILNLPVEFSFTGDSIERVSAVNATLFNNSLSANEIIHPSTKYFLQQNRLGIMLKLNEAPVLNVSQTQSPLLDINGQAAINNIWWALPLAQVQLMQPLEAEGNGALMVDCAAGLSANLKATDNNVITINSPQFLLEPGRINMTDTSSNGVGKEHSFLMWKEDKKFVTETTIRFLKDVPFIYNILSQGQEVLNCFAAFKIDADRPVNIKGEAVALRSDKGGILIGANQKNTLISITDFELLINKKAAPNDVLPTPQKMALALSNALLTTTLPAAVNLLAFVSNDFKNLIQGLMEVSFGLYAYLPTLPDPYVANLAAMKRQFERTVDTPMVANIRVAGTDVWMWVIAKVDWLNENNSLNTSFELLDFFQSKIVTGNRLPFALPSRIDSDAKKLLFTPPIQLNEPHPDKGFDFTQQFINKSKDSQPGLPNYTEDVNPVFTDFALLDVSSNANQMGVAFSHKKAYIQQLANNGIQLDANDNSFPLQIQGTSVITESKNAQAFTLPGIAWEPLLNLSFTTAVDPLPGFNYFPNDGVPTLMGNLSNEQVVLAPIPLSQHLVDTFKSNKDGKTYALFNMPFGMVAFAILNQNNVTQTTKPSIENVLPQFENAVVGGIQLELVAGSSFNNDNGQGLFEGYTFQLVNLYDQLGSAAKSTLGKTPTSIFNQEFLTGGYQPEVGPNIDLKNRPGVPVTTIGISGYGSSMASKWANDEAVFAQVSKAEFNVYTGRTSHELVQVVSKEYPFGAKFVRTITIFRMSNGYVARIDSGWKAQSPGLYDFSFLDDTTRKKIPSQFFFHPGIVKGIFNIRNIKEVDKPPFTKGSDVLQAITYDADILLENITEGGKELLLNASSKIVPSTGILGYIQLSPPGQPISVDNFTELLKLEGGSIGGSINCIIKIAGTDQHMKLNRFDVSPSVDGTGKSIFVSSARGSVFLPKDGSWSLVQHKIGNGNVTPLAAQSSVPLIKEGIRPGFDAVTEKDLYDPFKDIAPAALHRIADPANLLVTDTTASNYGFLQNMGSQKVLFLTPSFKTGTAKLLSKTPPLLADSFRLLNGSAIFPNIGDANTNFGQAISLLKAAAGNAASAEAFLKAGVQDLGKDVYELLDLNLKKEGEKFMEQGYELAKKGVGGVIDKALKFDLPNGDYDLVNLPDKLVVAIRYKTSSKPKDEPKKDYAGKCDFDVNSLAADATENWKGKLNNMAVVVSIGPMKELMTVKGNFNSQKGKDLDLGSNSEGGGLSLPTPEIEFSKEVEPVIRILEILASLSTGDYGAALKKGLKVAMSNSGDIWEYKFEASKEIPLVRFPPGPAYESPQTPLKLECSLQIGFNVNAALKVTTDPKQLLPTAGAFFAFRGRLMVMCVSVGGGSVFAIGEAGIRLEADTSPQINVILHFGFGAQIGVGLPVVGTATVTFMVGVEVAVSSNGKIAITAFMMFKGQAELLAGLVCICIMIEARGTVEKAGPSMPANCEVQVTFAIDVSIFLVINIHFSESWSESRQIA